MRFKCASVQKYIESRGYKSATNTVGGTTRHEKIGGGTPIFTRCDDDGFMNEYMVTVNILTQTSDTFEVFLKNMELSEFNT